MPTYRVAIRENVSVTMFRKRMRCNLKPQNASSPRRSRARRQNAYDREAIRRESRAMAEGRRW